MRPVFHKFCRRKILPALLLFLILVSLPGTVRSQVGKRDEPPPFRERMFYGGSFALQLGTFTNIEVLPVAGFWVLPRVAVAAGPGFRFYSIAKEGTAIFSGRAFAQVVLLRDIDKFIPLGIHTSIFVQAEDELMSLDTNFWMEIPDGTKRFYSNSILVGGGLSQQIGARSSMNIMVLWTVNEPEYQISSNPVFRIGFIF